MNRILKIVYCLGVVSTFGVDAMEPDWSGIADRTMPKTFVLGETEFCEEASKIFSWEKCSIDWAKVEQSANEGNPTAQYAFAGHLFELSGALFNGQRIKMRTNAYMYAIISAIVGDFDTAKNEYLDAESTLSKTSKISDFLEAANQMAMKEDF
ncbi:MAG: hypothetical protein LBQ08_02455 [Holosporaceae bacterium]|jgi:hypothetical protein|nr:hypothetical protein [Holosporaceae bacterium]